MKSKLNILPPAPCWTLLVLLSICTHAKGIDLIGAEEKPCFEIHTQANLDQNWMASVNFFYYPLMSRMDLYTTALGLIRTSPQNLQDSDIFTRGCFTFQFPKNQDIHDTTLIVNGFGNLESTWKTTVTPDGVITFISDDRSKIVQGRLTLTDNKTFLFFAGCLDGNESRVWAVWSTTPTLPEQTRRLILDHTISLGFDQRFFTSLDYSHCQLGNAYGSQHY